MNSMRGWIFSVCAILLMGAMGLRMFGMVSGGGQAFAEQVAQKPSAGSGTSPQEKAGVELLPPQDAQKAGEGGAMIRPAQVYFSPGEIEALQQLAARRDEIDARASKLDEREATLMAAEARLDRKTAELEALKGKIDALLEGEKKKEDGRIGSLVKVYESMKPKDAAKIFETLEADVLFSVASRMKEAKLAAVMAVMSPEKAKDITTTLALNPED